MVDVIVRSTVLAVMALAALNALHAAILLLRLVRHVAGRQPHFGLGLWLPALGSPADITAWLSGWRTVLSDPAGAAIRAGVRTVALRHLYLSLMSQTWAMAVAAMAPSLA